MEEFFQEFRRVARGSGYEKKSLAEEFKQEMNGIIRRKLMEIKRPLRIIKQWYKKVVNLDRHWRKNR